MGRSEGVRGLDVWIENLLILFHARACAWSNFVLYPYCIINFLVSWYRLLINITGMWSLVTWYIYLLTVSGEGLPRN
jgi:hypothetical protein